MADPKKPEPYKGPVVSGKPEPYKGEVRGGDNMATSIDREIDDWQGYAPRRSFGDIADDVMTVGGDAATFGFGAKANAKLDEMGGKGMYEAMLEKRRRYVQEAGERLGISGKALANLGGGIATGAGLGRLGGSIAAEVPAAAPMVTKMGASSIEGAGYGAAEGAGHTDIASDYITNILKGGLFGSIFGASAPPTVAGAQRILTPYPMRNPNREGMFRTLRNAGVTDVPAGVRVGSPMLQLWEDTIGKLPTARLFGGPPGQQAMEQVTTAAMERSGIPRVAGQQATPEVLREARQRIGGEIGRIQGAHPIDVDHELLNTAVRIEGELPQLKQGQREVVQHYLDRLTENQQITPEVASAMRSQLSREIRAQNGLNGDKTQQEFLINIRDALDDALERVIAARGNPADLLALQRARSQYANLHTLIDAIASSGSSGKSGTLTPTALAGAVQRSAGKVNATLDVGNMTDLGNASSGLLTRLPDSFTNTRASLLDPLKAMVAPFAQAAVNSRLAQRYWGNQQFPHPAPPAALPPAIAGATAAGEAGKPDGPADRIMKGLLMQGGLGGP